MKIQTTLLLTLCSTSPVLLAQTDDKKPPAGAEQVRPDPKSKEHDALKMFVGSWETNWKMNAVPGVPGMEKAMESKGTEQVELVANGLYLKWMVNGTFGGEPFQGLFLLGFDPHAKTYRCLWVDGNESAAYAGTGTYDEQKKSWEFHVQSPHGPMRTAVVFKGADSFQETCYSKGADGKESVTMDMTRTRGGALPSGKAAAVDAGTKAPKAPSKEHEELHKSVGDWDATVKMQMGPGIPASEDKATERVTAICGGRWLWTEFRGQMMGAPFVGHGLVGYDANQKKYVSYWLDSMSPVWMASTGTYDAAKKVVLMEGKGIDEHGKALTTKETIRWTDDHTRALHMEFHGAGGDMTMEITYKRKTKG